MTPANFGINTNLSDEDSLYLEHVMTDIQSYVEVLGNYNSQKVVLLFPPVNSFRRFLIHQLIESSFRNERLTTLSVGRLYGRRTVVYPSILKPMDVKCDDSLPEQKNGSERKTNSLPLYRPPALRNKIVDSCSRMEKRARKPDMQIYVPRGRRLLKPVTDENHVLHETIHNETKISNQKPAAVNALHSPLKKKVVSVSKSCEPSKSSSSVTEASSVVDIHAPALKQASRMDECNVASKLEGYSSINLDDRPSEETKEMSYQTSSNLRNDDTCISIDGSFSERTENEKTSKMQPQNSRSELDNNNVTTSSRLLHTNVKCKTALGLDVQNSSCKSDDCSFSTSDGTDHEEAVKEDCHNPSCQLGNDSVIFEKSLFDETKLNFRCSETSGNRNFSCTNDQNLVDFSPDCCSKIIEPYETNLEERVMTELIAKDRNVVDDTSVETLAKTDGDNNMKPAIEEKFTCAKPTSVSGTTEKNTTLNVNDCDWDELFDNDGDYIDKSLINELITTIGKVSVKHATQDYKPFQTTEERSSDGGCVVEIYGFPAEFKTDDLLSIFAAYRGDPGFQIVWVDNIHALAVFSSPSLADEILNTDLPFVKTRPIKNGSSKSRMKAQNYVPAPVTRPKTCVSLARRLVSGHLGMKIDVTDQQRAAEKKILSDAREKRRLETKLKQDAWEGAC